MLVEIKAVNKKEVTVVTSLDVAETFEREHKEIIRAIEGQKDADGKTKHLGLIEQLEKGGDVPVENYFIPSEYVGENGKKYKQYFITRDGFTLLVMGFSGERAMKFKLAYIKQFNAMEKALSDKGREREKGIAVRQALTKALQQTTENERMHGHAYSTYTDLAYRSIFGRSARQLREEFNISKKDNLRDFFSTEELQKVQNTEMLISSLMGYGWGYNDIKSFVEDKLIYKI